MDPLKKRDIVIGGLRFRDLDDLDDYCFYFPEFEDAVAESGLLSLHDLNSVNTYWVASELEYGDGNTEMPQVLHHGWYGDVLLDSYC